MPTPQIRYRNPVFGYPAEDTPGDELQKKASDDPTYPTPILNYVLAWNGSEWVPTAPGGGSGAPITGSYITSLAEGTLGNSVRLTTCIQTGTLASRPAASAVPAGSLYFATDSGQNAYRSDGATTWTAVNAQDAGALRAANNLTDVSNAATALANLGGTTADAVHHDLVPTLIAPNVGFQGVQAYPALPTGVVGGSLAGSLPNPTFAGRDASIDAVNKDMVPIWFPEATGIVGPQEYPPLASGVVGGSLAGSLPNPTFAGRDASVDKLNQDLLPSVLGGDPLGMQGNITYPGTTAQMVGASPPGGSPGRYCGSTIPTGTVGNYLAGDFVILASGLVKSCAVAGSPGVWVDGWTSGAGAVITNKGDLLVGLGTGNIQRQGVGTFGQVPTADATQADGLLYGNPPSGSEIFLARTNAKYETIPRRAMNNVATALVSGTVVLTAIYLPKDFLVTNIAFWSGTTAAGTPTHWWFTLCNNARLTLRSTADKTTTAWAASTEQIVALSSTFTTTYEGLYYLGIMMAATTPISVAMQSEVAVIAAQSAPILTGNSSTAQTTAPADGTTLTAITATNNFNYGYVS